MNNRIHIKPLGAIAHFADIVMVLPMYLVSGCLSEVPQRTHRWNNHHLSSSEIFGISGMLHVTGLPDENPRGVIHFHLPICGGWRNYTVIKPVDELQAWHIGWHTTGMDGVTGVSRIKLHGPVRMLVGPGDIFFFGVTPEGEQILLKNIGSGQIGDGGEWRKLPLL